MHTSLSILAGWVARQLFAPCNKNFRSFALFSPVLFAYVSFLLPFVFLLISSAFQLPSFLPLPAFLSFHFSFSSFPFLLNNLQFTFLCIFFFFSSQFLSVIFSLHIQVFFILWLSLLPYFSAPPTSLPMTPCWLKHELYQVVYNFILVDDGKVKNSVTLLDRVILAEPSSVTQWENHYSQESSNQKMGAIAH